MKEAISKAIIEACVEFGYNSAETRYSEVVEDPEEFEFLSVLSNGSPEPWGFVEFCNEQLSEDLYGDAQAEGICLDTKRFPKADGYEGWELIDTFTEISQSDIEAACNKGRDAFINHKYESVWKSKYS